MLDIINNLSSKNYLFYEERNSLGFANNSKILGCYLPKEKKILMDSALRKIPTKFNFVLGHELGHFVLHRNNFNEEIVEDTHSDSEVKIFSNNSNLKTDKDFLEWQANQFSSSILLPQKILVAKIKEIRTDMGISWKGKMYIDDQKCNELDYRETITRLIQYFNVSKTVIEIRLKNLDLIQDNRKSKQIASSVSDIMKEITKQFYS